MLVLPSQRLYEILHILHGGCGKTQKALQMMMMPTLIDHAAQWGVFPLKV